MILESKIIDRLKKIDQYHFERLIDNLIYQGAFPEIIKNNSSVESFGANIAKERTRKSANRSDSEIRYPDTAIEKSVNQDWQQKFKGDIAKKPSEGIEMFVFATNQDTKDKFIKINKKKSISYIDYCKQNTSYKDVSIIGSNEIVTALQKPDFHYIRRNFLSLPDDFLYCASRFKEVIDEKNLFVCNTQNDTFKRYLYCLNQEIKFIPYGITILHCENSRYSLLVQAIAEFGINNTFDTKSIIQNDFSFINWPYKNFNLHNIDHLEGNNEINNFIAIWNTHEIENLSDYLKFRKEKTSLILVSPTIHKEKIIEKLHSFTPNLDIKEILVQVDDIPEPSQQDINNHKTKIQSITEGTIDLLLKFESLVYFNSPMYLNNTSKVNNVLELLNISEVEFNYFKALLVKNGLAAVIGNILWIKKPEISKQLLNEFISKGVFNIKDLV